MTTTSPRRRLALAGLSLVALACDPKPSASNPSDPNAPAVVKGPPVILPSDTAKPDTMEQHQQRVGAARMEVMRNHAFTSAALVMGDARMIASNYSPSAVLVAADSTYTGVAAIARRLVDLGRTQSLREFKRLSLDVRIVDSTVIDSGTFVAISSRPGADSIVDRGTYVATWRMHPPPMHWVITRDELRPARRSSRR